MSTTPRGFAALAGVTAAVVAIGVAEPVAVLTGPRSAPLIAVGGVVVDVVPEPLKQFAIDVFGTYDKIALLVGTAVLLAAFAAGIGALAARRLSVGLVGIAAFAGLGAAAALTRAGADAADALPALVGGGLGALVLWAFVAGPWQLDPWPWQPPTPLPAVHPGPPPAAGTSSAAGPLPAGGPPVAGPAVDRVDGTPAAGSMAGDGPAADGPGAPAGPAGGPPVGWEPLEPTDPESRRRFLRGAGLLAGAATVVGLGGHWLAGRRGVSAAREAVALPTPSAVAPTVPPGADLSLAQLAPYTTPNGGFYRIDTALVVPQVDPATWRLRIHGRVRNPIELTFAELLARPMVERYVTLACVSNEVGGDLIGNARWLGVPIRELLDEAEPEEGADQVVGRSVDGWTCGTPTAALRDGRDALLAVGMNGEPLPVEHGFPVRMVVPGLYGYVSACKWVTELELTSFADFDAYWVPRGWSAQGPVKTQSRIDTPRPRNRLSAGEVVVAGVAWAQHRGISRVEVRVDGGGWQEATLAPAVSVDTWVQWSWRWPATAGEHTLQVRATDRDGETQTPLAAPVAPDGATGWHSVTVTVR
ncbi:DMSO/TMAO reductase YedYZ, molybdopterin-dependent catalytic subunit [Micromonospora matsumotoense]|uniref:DMSO/TMAO reductase YedYZ, molybdopterin-dependent catalytic subunit n=1 Tax=Micromonospora matsumotoense TaxID=121616 RepID=A0A1C4WEC8_9ACTN|nr:molybdopterin-dependent oxidoreductase [Micromonospora matsumotoense]SCE94489.1 DMSO/TMAO reductase YedYZ, molybdopterin-dependent catalytic subunit [Micromonospora matsumotoense]